MNINPSLWTSRDEATYIQKTLYVDYEAEAKDLILEDQEVCITGCKEFKYLGIKIDKEDIQENAIKIRINKNIEITAILMLYCGAE